MDFKQAAIDALDSVMPMFGMKAVYKGETEEAYLSSASQVNVLIGLTNGLKGNIVIGLKKTTALGIVTSMMGGMEINEMDGMAGSALGELANIIVGSAIGKLKIEEKIEFSPPTLAVGERMFLVISKVKSNKLVFKLDEDLFNISFCIE